MKKKLITIGLVITSFFAIITPNAFASPMGGWTEENGYWSKETNPGEISTFAAASPQSHTAKREYSGKKQRIVGNTKWKDKYHYTRARYERIFGGGVESDSDRVYGRNETTARSGYNSGDLVRAKTYYGT